MSWPRACVLLAAAFLSSTTIHAQTHKWSVTGSAGLAALNFASVDADNASDAEGWAGLGIPVTPFSSLKKSLLYSARVTYRYDREFAVSLIASYTSKEVTSSYRGSNAELDLARGVGSTDFVLGIAYYPTTRPYFLQWYLQVSFGVILARATAKAKGIQYTKVGPDLVPSPLTDTDATYTASKSVADAAIGIDVPLFSRVALVAEASYRFARFGILEGDVTRFGETSVQKTTIEFDYSGYLLTAGVRFEL
jgi:hypothetical protein